MIFLYGEKSHASHQIFGQDLLIEECGNSEILSWLKCGIARRILEESRFRVSFFREDIYPEPHSKV
jgi:hypothetical protein